ncbi:MAG: putative folate metabolism gamma-glutamate ligase [Candidatus Staskawiczbacteria bacterium]|nr:putative folate metabolism gamma-glutamate ligase [Candidatus Staskawiczbacteria bacterium]
MKVRAIKTRKFLPPKDDLFSFIRESFSHIKLRERSVIVVTSKIVSIAEGRCIKIGSKTKKAELIKREADFYIDKNKISGKISTLTIKDNILTSSSGIDESNGNGYYILWPIKPFLSAKRIYEFIKEEYSLKKFAVIISDSRRTPLREGILGIGLSYYGLEPLRDYKGSKDIFGREMNFSKANIVDSLSTMAVFQMGEGDEQTPLAIIEDIKDLHFINKDFSKNDILKTNIKEDKYSFFLESNIWKKGK